MSEEVRKRLLLFGVNPTCKNDNQWFYESSW
jgi:hypothetical protein